MSSQVIDTIIYSLVAWWGILNLRDALMLGAVKYGFKIVIAAIDTAFLYWAKAAFRQRHPRNTLAEATN